MSIRSVFSIFKILDKNIGALEGESHTVFLSAHNSNLNLSNLTFLTLA